MQNLAWVSTNPITGLPDMDTKSFLEAVTDYAWLEGLKPFTLEEQKQYVDDAYAIKDYIQQKEIQAQQQAQAQQPQQQQPEEQAWPSLEEMAMQEQANPQQPSTEDLWFIIPQQ